MIDNRSALAAAYYAVDAALYDLVAEVEAASKSNRANARVRAIHAKGHARNRIMEAFSFAAAPTPQEEG